jgi:hypothetical protein
VVGNEAPSLSRHSLLTSAGCRWSRDVMLDSSCWLPTTSRNYDSNKMYISSHPVRITACVCGTMKKAPHKVTSAILLLLFDESVRSIFSAFNPTKLHHSMSDSDRRHGTVPAPKSHRYGSVTRRVSCTNLRMPFVRLVWTTNAPEAVRHTHPCRPVGDCRWTLCYFNLMSVHINCGGLLQKPARSLSLHYV